MKNLLRATLAALLIALPAGSAEAEDVVTLTLDQAVERALKISPELQEAQAGVLFSEAQLDEAKAYRYPQLDTIGLAAPVPIARGDIFYSPDPEGDVNGLSFYGKLEAYVIQPLYAFGKIDHRIKAARHGRAVERAGVRLKASQVVVTVKEYYYGLLFAHQAKGLLDEVQSLLDGAKKQTKKLLDADDPNVEIQIDESALYRLDAYQGQLDALAAELHEALDLASSALAAVTGLKGHRIKPAEKYLRPIKMDLAGLPGYQDTALARRPEMTQLREGLKAMNALVRAAEADRWPTLAAAGYVSYAWAPDRTDINNPFIVDDFNHMWAGVGLAVVWHFDFGIQQAKIAQARAERLKIKAKENYALMNLPLQVTQKYLAVKKAHSQMLGSGQSYKAARRWLLIASANYDMGVGPISELTEALEKYATQQALYYKAIYDYNLGWAKLEQAIGRPTPEVKE